EAPAARRQTAAPPGRWRRAAPARPGGSAGREAPAGSRRGSPPARGGCDSGTVRVGSLSGSLRQSGGVMPLTRKQREILDFLSHAIERQGFAPSFEEIAEQFGYQSLATVHEHLTNLERKGYIRRSYNESRSIEVLPPRGSIGATEIPLLGSVAPATPSESRRA